MDTQNDTKTEIERQKIYDGYGRQQKTNPEDRRKSKHVQIYGHLKMTRNLNQKNKRCTMAMATDTQSNSRRP